MLPRLNDRQRAFVAAYIADPLHNQRAAAEAAGYKDPSASASKLMKDGTAVRAEIDKWRTELIAKAVETSELDNNAMIDMLERQLAALLFIQRERAKVYAAETGGASGMIVKRIRYYGSGDDVRMFEELAVDNATNKEIRETIKQLSIMRGEWTEKKEVRRGAIVEPITEVFIESAYVELPAGADSE